MKNFPLLFGSLLLLATLIGGCNNQGNKKEHELIIFHAGSLTVPVKLISKAFEDKNPGVKILTEAAGSVACARKITELHRKCDLMLSADYSVIDKFLIPKYSQWNIKFASNEMVIAFTDKSAFANKIDGVNWPEILLREEVLYGRSDPNSDPCGYRTALCLDLAEKYYNREKLSELLLEKDNSYIRPKETDLIALLETRSIDYIFIYRSVAVQHQLKFVTLPDSVNLKNPELTGWYENAITEINGKEPGQKVQQKGEPMVYGLTILKDAPNPELAMKFAQFFLEKQNGMKIMEENGQPSMVPSTSSSWQYIPNPLKKFALPAQH